MKKFRIPYGISSFEKLRSENYYFIDKSRYIEALENFSSQYLTFLRPRRFGKSLLVSMLESYYDINQSEKFEQLFKGTYIYEHPTPLRNSFMILSLSFSGIKVFRELSKTESEFEQYIKLRILDFAERYALKQDFDIDLVEGGSSSSWLELVNNVVKRRGGKLYLLIDEYDNFINEILVNYGERSYVELTHGTGFIRSFFKKIKDMTEEGVVDRVFITGVSPLAMNDLTSGYNIGDNISVESEFSQMVGINEAELDALLDYFIPETMDKEALKKQIRKYYNGYSFDLEALEKKIYNTTLVWYYLDYVVRKQRPPDELLDVNLMTDFGKLEYLIYKDKELNGNFSVLRDVLERGIVRAQFKQDFYIGRFSAALDTDSFTSLLFYLGLLTIHSRLGSSFRFRIPNLVTEELFWSYIREALQLRYSRELRIDVKYLREAYELMALEGEWRGVFEYILEKFYELVSLRDFIFKEQGVKMFFLAYVQMSDFYIIRSESEQRLGYSDIYLEPKYPEVRYRYLIEFKYAGKSEAKGRDLEGVVDELKKRAELQLARYSGELEGTLYKCIIIIAGSQELLYMDEADVGEARGETTQ